MFVHIILRGLNIERVFVRGLDEEDQMNGLDLFTESQYKGMYFSQEEYDTGI